MCRCFLQSFKQNLKQSTCIWLIFLSYVSISVIFYNIAMQISGMVGPVLSVIVVGMLILVAILCVWVLPLQARFINSIIGTFKNSLYMTFRHLFRTLLIGVLQLLPMGMLLVCVLVAHMKGIGIWLLFGVSVPIYWCVMVYDKIFEKLEEIVKQNTI